MSAPISAGQLVISRMNLLHKVAKTDSLKRTITLADGRSFDEMEFCVYAPEHHGPVGELEVCADCIPEIES